VEIQNLCVKAQKFPDSTIKFSFGTPTQRARVAMPDADRAMWGRMLIFRNMCGGARPSEASNTHMAPPVGGFAGESWGCKSGHNTFIINALQA
jgi:hypothetical protein